MITTHKYIKSKLKIGNYPDDRIVISFKECQMFSVFRVSKQLVVLSVLCHCIFFGLVGQSMVFEDVTLGY